MHTSSIEHPHLQRLQQENDGFRAGLRQLLDAHAPAQWLARPRPQAWSAAECVTHLRITAELYQPRLRALIDAHRAAGRHSEAPYRPGWFARWFIGQLTPSPSMRRVKAPRKFQPQTVPADWIDGAMKWEDDFCELLQRADGYELNGAKFGSPVTPLIRFTVGEGLTLTVRHKQRHLLQLQRALSPPAVTGNG